MENTIPHLTYQQFRTVQRLVHECCNNDNGNCLLLDDGWEPCVCVQSISRSLICKYFRAAVLPLDRELETALLYKRDSKPCCRCGALFLVPIGGNTAQTVLLSSTASRKQRVNGGGGRSVDN